MARVEEIGAGQPLVPVRDTNRYEPVLKGAAPAPRPQRFWRETL